jgi:hypothetical protein
MELDTDKIDDAVLALLCLGRNGLKAWKGFDCETLDRLHEKGYIAATRVKEIAVTFTEEGAKRADELLKKLFGKVPAGGP